MIIDHLRFSRLEVVEADSLIKWVDEKIAVYNNSLYGECVSEAISHLENIGILSFSNDSQFSINRQLIIKSKSRTTKLLRFFEDEDFSHKETKVESVIPIGLTLGIPELDLKLGGFQSSHLVVFRGSYIAHYLSELLCVRAQLSENRGGLASSAVFIDGSNIFNLYLISDIARQLDIDVKSTLRSIKISRAFTCDQLTQLIETLPQTLDQFQSKLVVISNMVNFYCEVDVKPKESREVFNRLTLMLRRLAQERKILIVVSSLPKAFSAHRWLLESYLLSRAYVVANVEQINSSYRFALEKHPSLRPFSVDFQSAFLASKLLASPYAW
ncbi:MAG: hypothetical protein ACE5KO_03660 [Candidatus Bathyarchaeia archaeon]